MQNRIACTALRYRWATLLLLCGLLSERGFADVACNPHADAKYETTFCRVKQSRYGRDLPSLSDFRRNPQNMQYLLLRKPASKLGISLPPPRKNAPPQAARKSLDRPVTPPQVKRADAPAASTRCSTAIDSIRCRSRIFQRLTNRSNKSIHPEALGASNRLLFSSPSAAKDEASYLLDAYVQYLNKMISIGLAGSTFSYSAFAHTYYEHQRNGTDFVERFRTMFEFLKQDKKNIGVSQRTPARPPDWRECEPLNGELIACHSQGMNLLYQASR